MNRKETQWHRYEPSKAGLTSENHESKHRWENRIESEIKVKAKADQTFTIKPWSLKPATTHCYFVLPALELKAIWTYLLCIVTLRCTRLVAIELPKIPLALFRHVKFVYLRLSVQWQVASSISVNHQPTIITVIFTVTQSFTATHKGCFIHKLSFAFTVNVPRYTTLLAAIFFFFFPKTSVHESCFRIQELYLTVKWNDLHLHFGFSGQIWIRGVIFSHNVQLLLDSHHLWASTSSCLCSCGAITAWLGISAQLCSNEGAPDSRAAVAASEVYYFCFVCEDAADVSAKFLQIHLGTLIHGWRFEAVLDAAVLQAKSKSTRIAVLVCTLCRVHEQICVTRWCSHSK